MTGRATMLPVVMVVVICVLAFVAISSERSNAPDVAGNDAYPHYVCTFENYCAGPVCTRERLSFVLYTAHLDGQPRVELANMSPVATLTERNGTQFFDSKGGLLSGTFELYRNREINFVGSIGTGDDLVQHFGSGECERLRTP